MHLREPSLDARLRAARVVSPRLRAAAGPAALDGEVAISRRPGVVCVALPGRGGRWCSGTDCRWQPRSSGPV
jgi:hypothetical protein